MPRATLIDFFADIATSRGEFLSYDDGYRIRSYAYAEVARAARAFAARLQDGGWTKGDKVLMWCENRPEWIVALWGLVLAGIVAVPIDYRTSAEFLERVRRRVGGRLVLTGSDVGPLDEMPADVQNWPLADLDWSSNRLPSPVAVSADDVVEIIFTSGATAEPKGVVITHRNILANIVPVEKEVLKYRKWGRPFFPIRFLNLLPLSHLFGQAMATFIPPMLPGTVVFIRGYNPNDIIRAVKARRVSVLVSVPKILEVLRDHVTRADPATADALPHKEHVLKRWWRYRAVHRELGLKFWSFVVGAAPLDPALEEFWSRLGFVVIQGYGLTETAPIVSLNHPFRTRKGSVGKAIAGVEMKIAPDGEILVRGENVTRGYFQSESETARAFEDGWFHTGDIGEIDAAGELYIRGRKKEMIVTPEGLNVFPEDVERVVNNLPGVIESAAVGVSSGGEERVHLVLVLNPGTDPDAIVRDANRRLEDHQRIRNASVWPDRALPRTEGTKKLRRGDLRQWVQTGAPPRRAGRDPRSLESILTRYVGDRPLAPGTTLEELGLSSLERVELMVELEDSFQTHIDEAAFSQARDLGELRALMERPPAFDAGAAEPVDFPAWNQTRPVRWIRNACLLTWILPLARVFAWVNGRGRSHLDGLPGPVIFASNHQSHLDTPVILSALPARWRYRLATAMAKEFFKAHFFPDQFSRPQWVTNSLNYYLSTFFFNAFPLPQREAGARQTLRYVGELLSSGTSVLIFPEGSRTEAGEVKPFRAGIGMMAARLGVPVVPVRLRDVDRVLHHTWKVPRPGRVTVTFGAPLRLQGDDYAALARRVEEAVRSL